MSDNKTSLNRKSVEKFPAGAQHPKRQDDSWTICGITRQITEKELTISGSSTVSFGKYRYQSESGRSREWFLAGFSPRKQALSLYIMGGVAKHLELMGPLGEHAAGKGRLYIKDLDKVHLSTLKKLIRASVKHVEKRSIGGLETDSAARSEMDRAHSLRPGEGAPARAVPPTSAAR